MPHRHIKNELTIYQQRVAGVISTADERSGICREQTKERPRERGNKRELWTKEQSAILVYKWRDVFQEIETFNSQALG